MGKKKGKKIPLLQAYQKAMNNPLRVSKRQLEQLKDAMRNVMPIQGIGKDDKWPDDQYEPDLGPSRMPGTNSRSSRKDKKKGKGTYNPSPLDFKGNSKGYI